MVKFYIKGSLNPDEVFETPKCNPIGGKGKDSTKCCPACKQELLKEELHWKSKYGMCLSCLFDKNKEDIFGIHELIKENEDTIKYWGKED